MNKDLTIAFIGGGNMATALAAGLAGTVCPAANIHVVDPHAAQHAQWIARGMTASEAPDAHLARASVWIYAVKPQILREVIAQTRPHLSPDTLVISVAAGLRADTLAQWLGTEAEPWQRLVRCMPNTPALVGAGATGLAALAGVNAADRALVENIMSAVGTVVWVADDAGIDSVTALSGSGPAYVFLFLEALIAGGVAVGLDAGQARTLALATLAGATKLAASTDEPPAELRARVTSKGGTTAAAINVFEQAGFRRIVADAMEAAAIRSRELAVQLAQ
jgi:pyrroline-5-carboxylate reductase